MIDWYAIKEQEEMYELFQEKMKASEKLWDECTGISPLMYGSTSAGSFPLSEGININLFDALLSTVPAGPQVKIDSKPSNPKDVIGSSKLPMGLVPDTLNIYASLSFLEGALKYGRYNWRVAGVRASIYKDAAMRHIAKWWNGEWSDPKTGVPHLASVLACIGIILDAHVCGKLTDDRPPRSDGMSETIDALAHVVGLLQEQFKDHNPKQYTIDDTPLTWPFPAEK